MSAECLRSVLSSGQRSFAPFFVLGDPTPEISLQILLAAVRGGSQMIELGFPFSDPVADGPAIQAADQRALDAGVTVDLALQIMADARQQTDIPFNLLVYGNLIHKRGALQFATDAAAAGASSLLAPDIPLVESPDFAGAIAEGGLMPVAFAGPGTSADRLRRLSAAGAEMVYLTGVQGVTGARSDLPPSTTQAICTAIEASDTPVCAGFGLHKPQHVEACLKAGASVAIVGSYLANIVANTSDSTTLVETIENTCRSFARAADPVPDSSAERTGQDPC